MIDCPCCFGDNIKLSDEEAYANIFGHAEATAFGECLDCGCQFRVSLRGEFICRDGDYKYEIHKEGRGIEDE